MPDAWKEYDRAAHVGGNIHYESVLYDDGSSDNCLFDKGMVTRGQVFVLLMSNHSFCVIEFNLIDEVAHK